MEARMKILVIDSTSERRDGLCDYLKVLKTLCDELKDIDVACHRQVWGDRERKGTLTFLAPGEIIFIHANDAANPGWATYLQTYCQNKYAVCYSGEGVYGLAWSNSKHFPSPTNINSLADIKREWDVQSFLVSVTKDDPNPFNKLNRLDTLLETKLEFLHLCLTPAHRAEAEELFKALSPLRIPAEEKTHNNVIELQNAFYKMISIMKSGKDSFSADYTAALEELREKLSLRKSKGA
jgi:hypothetical protein